MVDIDTSELRAFEADLNREAAKAASVKGLDQIVKRAAQGIKDNYAEQAYASVHFKGMGGSFSYDSRYSVGEVRYEIGPDKSRKGGALGNIFFFGGAPGGGGKGKLDEPLEKEGARMMAALDNYLGGIL